MARTDEHVTNTITGGIFLQAVIQGRDITVQLPPEITPALSGLPAPSAAFAGRDHDVKTLLQDLSPRLGQDTALVSTVSGLAGIGKTELVIQAATRALRAGWFPGGALFIDLFGYDAKLSVPAERALETLLRALAVPGDHIPDGLQDRQLLYRSVLARYAQEGRRILVVIDNVSTADQARPLLPTDSSNAALVTSRHTLDSFESRLHDLGPLDELDSVMLLDQAVRHARGNEDTRISSDSKSAAALARLCAGLPLALRISAALLASSPSRPTSSLVEALRSEHSRLDKLRRPDRAVRATFDLSHRFLDEAHARLFRLMSLQPGPDLSTETASRLVDMDTDSTEDLIQHLAEAHLVEPGQSWGRWRMHDLVRIYAKERVENAEEKEAALQRLFDFYLDHSKNAAAAIHGDSSGGDLSRKSALEWFDAERENLIASVSLAVDEKNLTFAAKLPHLIVRYLDIRRLFADWEEVMLISHSALEGAGDAEFEALTLDSLGMVSRMQHRFADAADYHRRAISLTRGDDSRGVLARCLNNLGLALFQQRLFGDSLAAHDEAAEIFMGLGNQLGFARATDNSASALRELGNLDEALKRHKLAISLFKELDSFESAARALTHLGNTLNDLGDYAQSSDAHRESIAILKELNLHNEAARALNNLAGSLLHSEKLEDALLSVKESIDLLDLTNDDFGRACALNKCAIIHLARQEFDLAGVLLEEALEILQEFSGSAEVAFVYGNLGRARLLTRDPVSAFENFRNAEKLFAALDMRIDVLQVRQFMGFAHSLIVAANEEVMPSRRSR
ncbi:ATP-binding protein [Streptomyces sp. SS]|uniref:ATP-binding protein n=1 Tax=Streptomyces sp. SS TaxID=260742 RepID=UPI0002FF2CE1|nr:tetratricopeptide repeat protein [Streptomyces sp. SS]